MDKKTEGSVASHTVAAAFEHLTGPARGTATWLNSSSSTLEVLLSDRRRVRVTEADGALADEVVVARLHRSGETYEIEAMEDHPLWVNGDRVSAKKLEPRDVIEFGQAGPLSRFELYSDGSREPKSVSDIFGDCVDYVRVSRRPIIVRLGCACRDVLRGFTLETTVLFRVSVVVAIIVLAAVTVELSRVNVQLQQQIKSEAERLETVSSALTRARKEALSPGDLNALRQELSHRLSAATERLALLEERTEASARVIAAAMRSIIFLQGSYGFRDKESGRMLRYIVDDQEQILLSPRGQPLLTLEGDGPVAERQFTGTAFIVTESGVLVTNRHVALPWEEDAGVEGLGQQGMEPVLIKFIGYLPEVREPFAVKLLKASEDADLAVLECSGVTVRLPHLNISDTQPKPGDEVIVMGYPTGLRSMLAQTGNVFIEELQESEDLDFWKIAARLSEEKFIRPLASRGIIGQVTRAAVVYDAETTHGGSGGPVLDIYGNVIAVNAAIIPEYGGSNLGVPADRVRLLLKEASAQS
ncbi:MAG TPA: serine protease [Gammaproteobacteria bacterium]|nr:serine protease [Gammaproteobacteria bacterium]